MTSTRAVSEPSVHRRLDRHDKGIDVRRFQQGENKMAEHLKLPWLRVEVDGEVGPRTEHTASLLLFAMGVYGPTIKRVRGHHEISEYAQHLIRGNKRRNPIMVTLAHRRREEVRKWRQAHEDDSSPQERGALADLIHLISKGMAYAWGGGHVTPADEGPGDCSWLASRNVQHFDPSIPTGTTYTLAEAGEPGFGSQLTLMIKNIPGRADESHVIELWELTHELIAGLKLQKWVIGTEVLGHAARPGNAFLVSECGGSDNPTSGNGPSFVIPGQGMGLTVEQRLAEFTVHRHVKGF